MEKTIKTHWVTFYKDRKGEYRWRLSHKNGRILADSGEGYKTRSGMRKSWSNLLLKLTTGQFGYIKK